MSLRSAALLLLTAFTVAGEVSHPGVQTFAEGPLAGQPLALAVDDAGRVWTALTGRAFGRGVPDVTANDEMQREDAAVFSLEDRRAAITHWLEQGKLKPGPAGAAESVSCLTDSDGDGRADDRVEVAGEFRDALDGTAGAVLPLAEGGVLFGCTPSLWKLVDDNDDLRADRRLPMLTGFGIRAGGGEPGLSALTEGPDGRIYFTTGARGCRVTSAEGERFVLEGCGGVWRCWPDGTELELIAAGLHHPAGLAVDLRGRIFVADVLPGGESTRLLRVLPGSDVNEPGAPPPLLMLPCRATGMIITPVLNGAASLPSLLLADGRAGGAVIPVTLVEAGDALLATAGPPLWQGESVGGIAAAPDGAVLWSGWRQGFAAGATVSILRLPPENPAAWSDGAKLLAGELSSLPPEDLPPLLEHAHPLVRLRARQDLTRLGFQEALDLFARTARRSPSLPARFNAMWGLAALGRTTPMLLNEVTLLFSSSEADVRALAVHIIGESGSDASVPEILPLLRDPAAEVRVEAAIALGRLRASVEAGDLATALHLCGEGHPPLRDALIQVLTRTLSPADLAATARDTDSPHVKTAALIALRRLRAAELADFLDDPSPDLARMAGSAIYELRVLPAYPALAAALETCVAQPALIEESFVRRALAAALRTGTPQAAAAVAAFAALPDGKLAAGLRTAALETLAAWDQPPSYDAPPPRWDPPLPRPPGLARAHLSKLQPDKFAVKPEAAALVRAFENRELSTALRADALHQLESVQPAKALELSRGLLPGRGTAALRAEARTLIMRLDSAASYTQLTEALATGAPQEMQAVLLMAQRFDSKQSDAFWTGMARKFIEGQVNPAARLEVREGLDLRDVASRGPYRRVLESVDAALDEAADPLARWRLCETGGDPDKGRLVFELSRDINCTSCHSLHGRGGVSGPELDHVASRLTRDQLLASLVQPSSLIAAGFSQVTLTLQDGTEVSGILRKRDDTALLLATDHGPKHCNADAVQSLSPPVSPMPSAATLLTPREIRDLMAWLETLK